MGVADIGIRVLLDDAASAGLMNVQRALGGLLSSSTSASGGLNALAAQQAATAGAFAGFAIVVGGVFEAVKFSVDAADQFQQALYSVAIATHVSFGEAQTYSDQLMTLGSNSIYTSSEIADGIAILGKAGYSIQEIFGGMAQQAIDLGEATRSSATDGFKLLSTAMSEYGASADQASQYADLLQWGFEHQSGTVGTYTSALAQVAPIARTAGMSLSDVIAALAVLAPQFSSTSTAGTNLRYAISGMMQPTAAALTEMASLGLVTATETTPAFGQFTAALLASGTQSADFIATNTGTVAGLKNLYAAGQSAKLIGLDTTFTDWALSNKFMTNQLFDSNGGAKSLNDIMTILSQTLKGMPKGEQLADLKTIFSVRGGQGIQDLLNDLPKLNGYLNQLSTSNNNAGGAAQRAAEMMATMQGAQKGLTTSLTDFGVVIGNSAIPMITTFFQKANDAVKAIRSFAENNQTAIPIFLGSAGAIGILGMAVTGLMLLAAHPIFAILVGSILAAITIFGGLALAIAYISQHMQQFHQIIQQVGQVLHNTIGVIATFAGTGGVLMLIGPFNTVMASLKALSAPALFQGFVTGMASWATAVGKGMTLAIQWSIQAAKMIATFFLEIGANLSRAAAWVLANLPLIIFIGLAILVVAAITAVILHFGVLHTIISVGTAIWKVLQVTFQQVAAQVQGAFLGAMKQLAPSFAQLQAALVQARPALVAIGMVVGTVLVIAFGVFVGLLNGVIHALAALLVGAMQVVVGVVKVFTGLITFFVGFFNLIVGLLTNNTAAQNKAWTQMGQGLLGIVSGIWTAIKGVFVAFFSAIGGLVSGFISGIVGFFTHLSETLVGHSIVPDMLNMIHSVFVSVLQSVLIYIGGIILSILAHFISLGTQLISAVQSAMNMAHNAFSTGVNALVVLAQSVPSRIVAVLAGLGAMLFGSGANAMQMFANGLGSVLGAVIGKVQQAAQAVANFLEHKSPAKMGPLANDDTWMPNMMKMFASGIDQHIPTVQGSVNRVATGMSSIPSQVKASSNINSGGSAAGGGTATMNLVMDSKVLTSVFMNYMTGQMQMNGMGRLMK